MNNDKIAEHGPYKISVEFFITDGDRIAKATFDGAPGRLPTADDLREAAESVLGQVRGQLGDGFRFQTRHEFVQELFDEQTGQSIRFSIPGPDSFRGDWPE